MIHIVYLFETRHFIFIRPEGKKKALKTDMCVKFNCIGQYIIKMI